MKEQKPEVWQCGPIERVPALLQPVAHALLQAEEEITETLNGIPIDHLWQRPANTASVAFHVQHITGVLDRLFTYARGEMLSTEQLDYLKREGVEDGNITVDILIHNLHQQIEKAIGQLRITPENILTEKRTIGRKQIPTTVIGLLFHAAEHTMRHTGQLLVTVKVIMENK